MGPAIQPAREAIGQDASAPANGYVSTEEWTWRLLDRGFSIEEAAAIRGLEVSAIVRHATWMVKKGSEIPVSSFLSEDEVTHWNDALRRSGPAGPPPEGRADDRFWPLFVACRGG